MQPSGRDFLKEMCSCKVLCRKVTLRVSEMSEQGNGRHEKSLRLALPMPIMKGEEVQGVSFYILLVTIAYVPNL